MQQRHRLDRTGEKPNLSAHWPGSAGYLYCGHCHKPMERPGVSYCSIVCAKAESALRAKGEALLRTSEAMANNERAARSAGALREDGSVRTIWDDDALDGPSLICPPPKDKGNG
ncbi:MAG TPA: hypothetical protein VFG22_01965 [Polyangiales bacterium]|nr:hypothetical protein [Polyangiales bacterium]